MTMWTVGTIHLTAASSCSVDGLVKFYPYTCGLILYQRLKKTPLQISGPSFLCSFLLSDDLPWLFLLHVPLWVPICLFKSRSWPCSACDSPPYSGPDFCLQAEITANCRAHVTIFLASQGSLYYAAWFSMFWDNRFTYFG